MPDQPEPACLVLADISGYTSYLAGVELDHAQDILADLTDAVVRALRPTFRLAKLEGDAAFAYAITETVDGVVVVGGREGIKTVLGQPIWAAILLAPIFLAGLNLVAFRQSHEVVCRMEVERHRWLSVMVGRGYSARTFALTGIVLLVLGMVLIAWILSETR